MNMIMKKLIHKWALGLSMLLANTFLVAQTPANLGVAGSFVLFSTDGAVSNMGTSMVTGNVGSDIGGNSGFGNINGEMHDGDAVTGSAATDLSAAYNDLGTQVATMFPGTLLGGGQVLTPAVYSIPTATTLDGTLILDGLGDANACFVFQLTGALSAIGGSNILLINGTQSCNVFWRVDGASNIAAGASFKGTMVCDGAITLAAGVSLDGRALSIAGAIAVSNVTATEPAGCGSPALTGPPMPDLRSTFCYALFTTIGALTNSGITNIVGDIGTNDGPVSGYNQLLVTGTVHWVPDASTAQAAADLNDLYLELNALPCDIELLYPSQFGRSQVLTPHVYCLNAATQFSDTIFLDARGNPSAVFVFKINGGFTTATFANVVLRGGALAENVFWKVEGAVGLNDFTQFKGTIVANNGAITMLNGSVLEGRALSTNGAITTNTVNVTSACGVPFPVEMLYFKGSIVGQEAQIFWATTNEINVAYFDLEESEDLQNWQLLTTLDALVDGNSVHEYRVTDRNLNPVLNCYRIKQVDLDGQYKYFQTLVLSGAPSLPFSNFAVYPNPTSDLVNIAFSMDRPSKVNISLMDMTGRLVGRTEVQAKVGSNHIVQSVSDLPAGAYLIAITSQHGMVSKQLIRL
jgi:hypothetical protein